MLTLRPFFAAFFIFVSPQVWAAEVGVKNHQQEFSTGKLEKAGSGSGLVIEKRFVLTNRHCVQDDKGNLYSGFRIFFGSDYKSESKLARVVMTSVNYDLALLELESDAPVSGVSILSKHAPLATKIVAFGFPLGSKFGVSLTASGGQISRHPVETSEPANADISSAIWHDAVIASGSSGGPICSENGVLLGLNFATLKQNSSIALAVPSDVICRFLEKSPAKRWTKCDSVGQDKAKINEQVVYIEILSKAGADRNVEAGDSLGVSVVNAVRSRISSLSDAELNALLKGDLKVAFVPTRSSQIQSGDLVRIKGAMTIIQCLDDGMLVEIDGVRCFITAKDKSGGEFAAKIGNAIIRDVPHDAVYFVLKATPYETRAGTTAYYIPLVPAVWFVTLDDMKPLVEAELPGRRERAKAEQELNRKLAAELEVAENVRRKEEELRQAAKRKEDESRQLENRMRLIRREFRDVTGKFSVDAVCVLYDGENATLMRLSDSKRISLRVNSLSGDDQAWLKAQATWIRLYGPAAEAAHAKK